MPEIIADCPDDATAVLTAQVPLARDVAFRAFSEVSYLDRWFWPERLQTTIAVDATVGGVWRARSEVIAMGFTAVFGEVVPGARLAMSWQWDEDDAISKVEIDFAADDDRSVVTVTHGANPTLESRDEHRAGWTDCLTRLTALPSQ